MGFLQPKGQFDRLGDAERAIGGEDFPPLLRDDYALHSPFVDATACALQAGVEHRLGAVAPVPAVGARDVAELHLRVFVAVRRAGEVEVDATGEEEEKGRERDEFIYHWG